MAIVIKIFLALIIIFGLDRIGLWAEKKGYIYWRKKRSSSSGLGNALGALHAFYQPEVDHIIEIKEKKTKKSVPNKMME